VIVFDTPVSMLFTKAYINSDFYNQISCVAGKNTFKYGKNPVLMFPQIIKIYMNNIIKQFEDAL